MISIKVENKELLSSIGRLDSRIRANVYQVIRSITIELEANVKKKLSGEVLHVRTGLLRNSITSKVMTEADAIVGVVGTNVKYGKIHEFGFRGVVTVSQHMRRTRAQMSAARYSYVNKEGERVYKTRQTGAKGRGAGTMVVSGHKRTMNMPERSFLRSALREISQDARVRIADAVMKASK